MLQQNIVPIWGSSSLTWVMLGYSLAFGIDTGNGLIAEPESVRRSAIVGEATSGRRCTAVESEAGRREMAPPFAGPVVSAKAVRWRSWRPADRGPRSGCGEGLRTGSPEPPRGPRVVDLQQVPTSGGVDPEVPVAFAVDGGELPLSPHEGANESSVGAVTTPVWRATQRVPQPEPLGQDAATSTPARCLAAVRRRPSPPPDHECRHGDLQIRLGPYSDAGHGMTMMSDHAVVQSEGATRRT